MSKKKSSVEEKDRGWRDIKRRVENSKNASVRVGVLGDAGQHSDGTDLISIAIKNEFGTDNIPERSFIRASFDEHRQDLKQFADRLWQQIMLGNIDVDQALGLLGEKHQGQIQDFMTALTDPPNAESTIEMKGSSNPLIDQGDLRRSIRWTKDQEE